MTGVFAAGSFDGDHRDGRQSYGDDNRDHDGPGLRA
jgi:hypothetical protein